MPCQPTVRNFRYYKKNCTATYNATVALLLSPDLHSISLIADARDLVLSRDDG